MVCFCNVSNWSDLFRHHLAQLFGTSNQSVPFTCWLVRLCYASIWPVSLRHQLVVFSMFEVPAGAPFYISNRSVSLRYQLMHFFDVLNKLHFFSVSGATSLRRLKRVSPIYVPVKKSLCRLKLVGSIYVPVVTSLRRLKFFSPIQVTVRMSL